MLCSLITSFPAVHDSPTLSIDKTKEILILQSILGSFIFDYNARFKIGYLHLTLFTISETSLLKKDTITLPIKKYLQSNTMKLCCPHEIFSTIWLPYSTEIRTRQWKSLWAITPCERLRLRCILDAIVAELYGLSYDDFSWILRDCGYPTENIRELSKTFDSKGFWRVDKDKDPELRHTVLTLKAFADLKAIGLDAFCALNDGEGWMIPETLTYKVNPDGIIVFDTVDGKTVPVRERLGPRFLDWQLAGTPEESWKECEMHARNILGEEGFAKLMEEIASGKGYQEMEERIGVAEKVLGVAGAAGASGVAEVLKKAEEQKKELERKEKGQRTLGEW
jgi:hypothetical protein